MEYNIRIELQDKDGKMLAGTTMTEEHANAIKRTHGVDVLLDTIDIMKKGAATTEEIESIRAVDPNETYGGINARSEMGALYKEQRSGSMTPSVLSLLKDNIDKRKGEPQDPLWPWIEDGIPVTREEVQDYMTYFGTTQEVAYDKLKRYATGETQEIDSLEVESLVKRPLTPEQISELFNAIGPAPADHPWNGGNVLP